MSYLNRPCESNYYEADREVIREGPYGSYSAEYRIDEYGNRIPHHNYNHNHSQNHHGHKGVGGIVSELVKDVISGGHKQNHNQHQHQHQHHHHGPTEYIERREECVVDSTYDPYRRMY